MNVKRPVLAVVLVFVVAGPAVAQRTEYRGAEALGLELRRLGTTARVLMIGAHPDDENNALLTAIALGTGADVAYLSLTRGDGGQNLIGPELTEGLGLIRSEELLAARRLDGAGQYFGREYDYGFSKSADEAFSHWPRDSALADAVQVIRGFKPDVILSVWSGTPADGHGQHQAAGIVTKAAFEAAADPSAFPGQIAAGLPPHRTSYMFQASWRGGAQATRQFETGRFDPLFGRSWNQISQESRSRHRSQDQGSEQTPGSRRIGLIPMAGAIPSTGTGILDGLSTTLPELVTDLAPENAELARAAGAFATSIAEAVRTWNPMDPGPVSDLIESALDALDRAGAAVADLAGPAGRQLRFRIDVEREQAGEALRLASGIRFDPVSSRARVAAGEEFELSLRLWNGGGRPAEVESIEPDLPDGWEATALDGTATMLAPGALAVRRFSVRVPAEAKLSEAYYLREPRDGDLYRWPADTAVRGRPFAPSPVQATARVRLDGHELELGDEATFVDVDKALGERRLPVLIVPRVNVLVDPPVAVAPVGAGGRAGGIVTVTVSSDGAASVKGTLRAKAPPGWRAEPAEVAIDLGADALSYRFTVTPPADVVTGRYPVDFAFETPEATYTRGYTTIDYPHIRPHLLFRDSRSVFSAFPVAVAQGLRVGYIEGAGDDGAAALQRLGLDVRLITPAMLESGDLSPFDVIVTGIRAYEVRADLAAANAKLLEWVRNGGTCIVQYNKQELVEGGFAPYPVGMASGDRVTDEGSPVTLLAPTHPALTWPNRITQADFEGWVQERGLYFLNRWDDRYTPLLEMNDPGEPPQRGILLSASVGRGTWVYAALSLFRELPEGVPGSYRLLANLVSLGAADRPAVGGVGR